MKIFSKIICLIAALGGPLSYSAIAVAAGKRVAIIEAGSIASAQLEEFDILEEGMELNLGAGESVVIGYMTSCIRETITGGRVLIGAKQSEVNGGKVAREDGGQCAEPRLALTATDSQQSGTIAFRDGEVTRIVFSRTPILRSRSGDTLFVEIVPLQGGKSTKLKSENGRIDLAAENIELEPGRSYQVKTSKNTVTLEVDPGAMAGGNKLERIILVN